MAHTVKTQKRCRENEMNVIVRTPIYQNVRRQTTIASQRLLGENLLNENFLFVATAELYLLLTYLAGKKSGAINSFLSLYTLKDL